LRPKQFACKDC